MRSPHEAVFSRAARRLATALATALLVAACATSPLGRQQLKLFPEGQMSQMGTAAYQQIQQEEPIVRAPATLEYIRCITSAIVDQLPPDAPHQWEVTVFDREEANAFALPGGKLGVNEGIIDLAENQAQLATVVGHEIAHVLADHPNERVSTQYATRAGLDILQVIAGGGSERQQLFNLLGIGAQVGIVLPFTRAQETEADLLGLDLMAAAGFDPRQSIELWRRMERQGGDGPPPFLSTHPSGENRIERLGERMPHAMEIYRQAQARGRTPNCSR